MQILGRAATGHILMTTSKQAKAQSLAGAGKFLIPKLHQEGSANDEWAEFVAKQKAFKVTHAVLLFAVLTGLRTSLCPIAPEQRTEPGCV